jgi:hypothetical protein
MKDGLGVTNLWMSSGAYTHRKSVSKLGFLKGHFLQSAGTFNRVEF